MLCHAARHDSAPSTTTVKGVMSRPRVASSSIDRCCAASRGCAGCTCCSSSSWGPDACTSPVSPQPERCLGDPTGPQPHHEHRPRGVPVSHPRPRHQVHGALRRSFLYEGIWAIQTPVRAPKGNASAERVVRRSAGSASTEHSFTVTVTYCCAGGVRRALQPHRPHRGLDLSPSEPTSRVPSTTGAVTRQPLLGGLVNEYQRRAA
jgi:hypothetical protein